MNGLPYGVLPVINVMSPCQSNVINGQLGYGFGPVINGQLAFNHAKSDEKGDSKSDKSEDDIISEIGEISNWKLHLDKAELNIALRDYISADKCLADALDQFDEAVDVYGDKSLCEKDWYMIKKQRRIILRIKMKS